MNFDEHLSDTLPGFDAQHFNHDCPRKDCDGHVAIDHMAVTSGPTEDSTTLTVTCRCTGEFCGYRSTFEPAIDRDVEQYLRALWGEVTHTAAPADFYPWSDEHTDDVDRAMEEVYTDNERQIIRDRLDDLGYW